LHAQEREYALGGTLSLVDGITTAPIPLVGSQTENPKSFFTYYGVYPSVTMSSIGANSAFAASYAFGLNRIKADTNFNSASHSASINFTNAPAPKWKLHLADMAEATSDATTFNSLGGSTPSNESFRFIFYPVAAQVLTLSNSANVVLDYQLNGKSALSLIGSHTIRSYRNGQSVSASLSNQQLSSGGIAYKWRPNEHEEWSFGYTGAYAYFKNFEDIRSDTARVGYSNQFAPGLNLEISAGASENRTQKTADRYIGYNSSVSLRKVLSSNSLQGNSFALYYGQDSGQSTGLGSVSNIRRAGLSLHHDNKSFSISGDASVFDARGTLGNTLNLRGALGTATVGIPLTRTLAVQVGGQYQHYSQTTLFGFTQKLIFFSLKYTNSHLWTRHP
jgi:hypothetical protein